MDHKESGRIYREYKATDKILKQQLLGAVNELYYQALSNPLTGYAGVKTLDIITHLYAKYGKISAADLADNEVQLRAPYDAQTSMETLFSQIERAERIAKARNASYSKAQLVQAAYNTVFQTGMYNDACREWRRRPNAEKTWDNFKEHYETAQHELQESQLTTQGAGYHANSATHNDMNMDAYAYLTTTTVSEQSAISQLTSTNSQLSVSLTQALGTIQALQADMGALKNQLTQLTNQQRNRNNGNNTNNNHNSSNGSNGNKGNSNWRNTNAAPSERIYFNQNYCWTHGWHVHNNHTSENCRNPRGDHQKDATRDNNKGGSQKNKNLVA